MPIQSRAGHRFTRPGDVRVATFNPWQRYGDWPARRAVIVDGLASLQLDLVAFVEVVKTDDYDQTEDLVGPATTSSTRRVPLYVKRGARP
jgi:hypothetical protein